MTAVIPEQEITEYVDLSEFEDVEIPCDIMQLRHLPSYPPCLGDPARWVAWRARCCPESPAYRLLCDRCKVIYQKWAANQAHITCGFCGAETGGFLSFTELGKRA